MLENVNALAEDVRRTSKRKRGTNRKRSTRFSRRRTTVKTSGQQTLDELELELAQLAKEKTQEDIDQRTDVDQSLEVGNMNSIVHLHPGEADKEPQSALSHIKFDSES